MNINEIASLSGVSIGTVDRVIHKRGRVSKDTEAKVQEIIKQTGYAPNALARQLKLKKPHKVGVLMPSVQTESGYWQEIVSGMERAINEELRGFAFSIDVHKFDRRDRNSLYTAWQEMKASDACAFVIAPVMQEEVMCLLKNENSGKDRRPYCFIDTQVPGLVPACMIGQNPYHAGLMTGKLSYLTSKRQGEFVVISTDTEAYNLNERVRGFIEWMASNDLPAKCVFCDGEEELSRTVHRILTASAVAGVCVASASTHIAAEVLSDMGMKDSVSVVGFDLVAENKALLLNGTIDALIAQRPDEQGYLSVMQIYHKVVLDDTIRERIEIPIDVYFKENVLDTLNVH